MLELEDLIPVKTGNGLVVLHTPEEYARLWRGVDREVVEAMGKDLEVEDG